MVTIFVRSGPSLSADDIHLPSPCVVASSSSAFSRGPQVHFCSKQIGRRRDLILMLPSHPVHKLNGFVQPLRTKRWRSGHGFVRAFAMELAEEAQKQRRDDPFKLDIPSLFDNDQGELSMPSLPRNSADDVSLHNPLLRLHRMGCGWLGVIMEWDGVIVEDDSKLEREAWLVLAQEEGRRPPPAFILKKAEGMKREQAVSEVLCWTRDPKEMRRLALRGEEIFQELQGGIYRQKPGAREFVLTLKKLKIPIALASTKPRRIIDKAVEAVGLEGEFSCIVSAEDVYRGKPDPEMYMYAAQLLGMIPERCIVVGNSNSSVEAAHDTYMKCIAVAGKHPIYELGAADLVITRFDNLSFVDLKNLADLDSPEFHPPEPQLEVEPEEEPLPKTGVALSDRW
ncbi:hypothetical protein L7F22_023988 [Adiantum nelumboides]|nr:hypothetical protein [Adiantum nelumboides]